MGFASKLPLKLVNVPLRQDGSLIGHCGNISRQIIMLVWLLDFNHMICAYLSFSFLDKGMFKISIWDFFPIDLHVAQSKDFHNAANHKTWWIMQFKYLYPQKQICTQAFELYIWDFTCCETYSVFLRLVIVAQVHMNSPAPSRSRSYEL